MDNKNRASILVVDDNSNNLQILADILRSNGFNVATAKDGFKALRFITKKKMDIILLDIKMPIISGYDLCEQLKADEATRDIPVIFISALNEVADKIKAFAVGGVDYITKPFQADEVLARVKLHLFLRNLQKELQEKNEELEKEIREHKQTAKSLAQSEARFRSMFAEHSAPMLLIDPKSGKIVDANPAALSFYNYTSDELCSLSMFDINRLPSKQIAEIIAQAENRKKKLFYFTEPFEKRRNSDSRSPFDPYRNQ